MGFYKTKKDKYLLYGMFFFFLFLLAGAVHSVTRNDQTGFINIKLSTIASMGFSDSDCLVSTTLTLGKPYTNVAAADFYTNKDAITNNNWCERGNDSVDPAPDPISNSELTGMWVTWDTNFLYIAMQGQAMGRHNNLMCLIDSNVDKGYNDFNKLTHTSAWKRDILFDEGIMPNVYLGFWCNNNTANYNGTDSGGNTKMFYGNGQNSWIEGKQMSTQTETSNAFYAWYNGSSQANPSLRVWAMKIRWSVITNSLFVSSLNNLEIRIAGASTGPDDGSLMYDYIPETQYAIVPGVQNTIQNNYFRIKPFDSSGNIRIGINPRDDSSINFMPGSRWDVANYPSGSIPINMYNDSGVKVKAFSPNSDTINDTIRFSFALTSRGLVRCSLKIFDLKGRLVKTMFSGQSFLIPTGWAEVTLNGAGADPNPLADARLIWDGTDDNAASVPMGLYVAVFEGEDGTIRLQTRRSVFVLK